jgi:hypothetical protein
LSWTRMGGSSCEWRHIKLTAPFAAGAAAFGTVEMAILAFMSGPKCAIHMLCTAVQSAPCMPSLF